MIEGLDGRTDRRHRIAQLVGDVGGESALSPPCVRRAPASCPPETGPGRPTRRRARPNPAGRSRGPSRAGRDPPPSASRSTGVAISWVSMNDEMRFTPTAIRMNGSKAKRSAAMILIDIAGLESEDAQHGAYVLDRDRDRNNPDVRLRKSECRTPVSPFRCAVDLRSGGRNARHPASSSAGVGPPKWKSKNVFGPRPRRRQSPCFDTVGHDERSQRADVHRQS